MKKKFKQIIGIFLGMFILVSAFSHIALANENSASSVYYGDVDVNEIVDSKDALLVLKHAAKLSLIDSNLFDRADVVQDNNIDALDALEILKYSAKLIDKFSCMPAETIKPDETASPEATETVAPTETAVPSLTPTDTALPTATPLPSKIPDIGGTDMPDNFSKTVWIMGDSIAAYHEKTASVRPLYGWGELISEYFNGITFNNHGISSQSTSSYYNLQKTTYDYVFNNMHQDDYVIISFGHNDHNSAKLNGFDRRTDPEASSDTKNSYKWWLKNYYIDPVLNKGATPILMSSVVRCTFNNDSFYEEDIHLKYGKAMEELIEEYAKQGIKIYYIDAQDYTYSLYSTKTFNEAKLYHGQYGTEGRNYFDNTHFSEAGARMIIEYMISELRKTDLSIKNYIR